MELMQVEQQRRRGRLPAQQVPRAWPVRRADAPQTLCCPEGTPARRSSPIRGQIEPLQAAWALNDSLHGGAESP